MPSLLHRQAEAGGYRRPGGALRASLRAEGQEVAPSLEQLRAAKLRALVTGHWDREYVDRATPSVLPGGAALHDEDSSRAWVLVDDGIVARLGAALAWSDRRGVTSLDVLVDASPSSPGIMARRASVFRPAPTIWAVSGTHLERAVPMPPVPDMPMHPDPHHLSLLESRGLEVVHEHGVLRGEHLGLEVARTVGDRLEVGVGRHDRSARLDMRPDEDLPTALDSALSAVRRLRRPGAPSHPANTLARSRWMRAVALRAPRQFGLRSLSAVAPPLPWFDLPEVGAAPAVGTDLSGGEVVVVFSVGVDPDLVPTAADCRLLYGTDPGELWLCVPQGDDLPVTRSLASRLEPPATVRTVPRGWETLAD